MHYLARDIPTPLLNVLFLLGFPSLISTQIIATLIYPLFQFAFHTFLISSLFPASLHVSLPLFFFSFFSQIKPKISNHNLKISVTIQRELNFGENYQKLQETTIFVHQFQPRRSRYIIEEVPDSYLFIPMPQSSQVANHPSHSTLPHMHPTLPPMHPTPPHMHPTPPMSGSFTGLLSTPPGCTPFPPISPTTFISPTGYTPYFPTGPDTYFPMPSMQSSGPFIWS
ncbi:hypothetical protein RYX36_031381 [Vicia faba]